MHRLTRFSILIFTLAILLFSCTKDDQIRVTSKKLLRTETHIGDSVFLQSFDYDADGRIITQSVGNTNGSQIRNTFEYNSLGQVIKVSQFNNNNSTLSLQFVSSDSIVYDTNHVNIYYTHPVGGYWLARKFTTDAKGRVIADSLFNYISRKVYGYIMMIYDEKDNITEWNWVSIDLSYNYYPKEKFTATYDESINKNPIRIRTTPDLFTWFVASKHNPRKVVSPDGNINDFSYEYDKDGLITKSAITHTLNGMTSSGHFTLYFYD